MRACKMVNRGYIWISFGIGCFVACWFPSAWLAGLLSLALVILGCFCCRR